MKYLSNLSGTVPTEGSANKIAITGSVVAQTILGAGGTQPSDQPRTSNSGQEWTAETVMAIAKSGFAFEACERIAQAHSAALAGCTCQRCGSKYLDDVHVPDELWERIKPEGKAVGAGLLCGQCIFNAALAAAVEADRKSLNPILCQRNEKLEQQLAAEREATHELNSENNDLLSKLLAAQAAIEKCLKKWNPTKEDLERYGNRNTYYICARELQKAAGSDTALREHDAKVREPLMEAGSKLANLLKDSYWAECPLDVAKAADELLNALAKVKE
jgi:hypothetical protein